MTASIDITIALKAQLQADDVASGEIYHTRLYKLPDDILPAVFITAISDSVDYSQSTSGGGFIKQMRTLEVEFVIKALGASGEDTSLALNGLVTELENSMYNNKALGINVHDTRFQSIEYEYSGDSEHPRGTATVLFEILYQMKEPNSDIIV